MNDDVQLVSKEQVKSLSSLDKALYLDLDNKSVVRGTLHHGDHSRILLTHDDWEQADGDYDMLEGIALYRYDAINFPDEDLQEEY